MYLPVYNFLLAIAYIVASNAFKNRIIARRDLKMAYILCIMDV